MRPVLDLNMAVEDFRNYYFLKTELQEFCREHELSPAGSKGELAERVAIFLETGERRKPAVKKVRTVKHEVLSLDTVITEGHRCSQDVRAFFSSVIPGFHFSTYIQSYFKGNVGKSYRDVVEAWYQEVERKMDKSYQKEIPPQFEYNTFIRDFFADHRNKGKTQKDAIQAWKEIKQLPGSNRYRMLAD